MYLNIKIKALIIYNTMKYLYVSYGLDVIMIFYDTEFIKKLKILNKNIIYKYYNFLFY